LKSSEVTACFYPNRLGAVKPGLQPRKILHQVPANWEALPSKHQHQVLLTGVLFSDKFYALAMETFGCYW
jgi:hypothetical protein